MNIHNVLNAIVRLVILAEQKSITPDFCCQMYADWIFNL